MDNACDNTIHWETLDDSDLVKLAQTGDRGAFGELVRRHRAKMYGYARTITHEAYLAEDIVQDALVRAFLHLGKLVDAGRFLPWVQRIVRNQARTKLTTSSAVKERTFTELDAQQAGEESGIAQWNSLDSILHRLGRSRENVSELEHAPEERLLKKETLAVLTEIIGCLKPRERLIFESHFFDQLSPAEIAKLFQLSSANVYQIISRSRRKVVQEKIRVMVDTYVKTRKDLGKMKKVIVEKVEHGTLMRTWTTAADALHAMLQSTEKRCSFAMVMGLTGLAFRITIIPGSVHIAGPTAYHFADILGKGLKNMGVRAKVVDGTSDSFGPNTNLLDSSLLQSDAMEKRNISHALPQALELIHHSLGRGIPVLAWDIFFPEFGLIYGYDDEARLLYADQHGRKETLRYENLGRSILEELFVLAIDEVVEVDEREQLRNALQLILDHYDGKETRDPATAVSGIAAYDVWCDAFRNGSVEPNGNAYNVAVIKDGRTYAAQFLEEAAASWPSTAPDVRPLLNEAARVYTGIADMFGKLQDMYPFPQGGEPNRADNARQTIELLQAIKQQEQSAVDILRNIARAL